MENNRPIVAGVYLARELEDKDWTYIVQIYGIAPMLYHYFVLERQTLSFVRRDPVKLIYSDRIKEVGDK